MEYSLNLHRFIYAFTSSVSQREVRTYIRMYEVERISLNNYTCSSNATNSTTFSR